MSTMTPLAAIKYRRKDGEGWLTITSEPDQSRAQHFAWGSRVPNTWVITADDGTERRVASTPEWLEIVHAECTNETISVEKEV